MRTWHGARCTLHTHRTRQYTRCSQILAVHLATWSIPLPYLPPAVNTHANTHSPPASQVLEILAEHLATWSCSVAFPELAHVPLLHLRKFAKACPVDRFK